jgi:hypothetical protein
MRLGCLGPDMAAENDDTARTAVKTYVPAYQRDTWDEHADELDMSRSEFVRSMVQAGRKGFDPRGSAAETGEDADTGTDADDSEDTDAIEEEVLAHLEDGPRSWDELFEAVAGDIETRLEDALEDLQESNRVRYSGREGGYVRAK